MQEATDKINVVDKILTTRTATKAHNMMRSPYGTSLLAVISFLESLLPLPILTDPFLAAAIMINRDRVWKLFLVTTVTSVIGGICAYFVAVMFRDLLFAMLSVEMVETINSFVSEGQETFVLTILGAVTPVPYTIIAWAVALSKGSPLVFIVGSVIGRSFRYGIVSWCTYKFGPAALKYAKRSIWITSLVIFVIVGLYIWMKM